ncbi:MAG: VOC family protein [Clostridiales Family XIII bacterium]|jgi:PhnB protein|nr:VOC family protein [Clostridiales Family XIII bacterium]
MTVDPFLYFDGNCREALEFYTRAFGLAMPAQITTYDQVPGMSVDDANRGRILYTSLPIFGHNFMLADQPAGAPYVKGGNVALTLGTPDHDLIRHLFAALSDGGEVTMELGQTFFSALYGMVTDRFGVNWQFSATPI